MSVWSEIRERLRSLLFRRREERDLDEEIGFHIEMETERLVGQGVSQQEAERRARASFGGIERHKEGVRDERGTRWLEDFGADARYGLRTLRRSPAFTGAAIITLALGIGATTSIFGVVNALFLRYPEGIDRPSELVRLYIVRDEGMIQVPSGGPGSYVDYQAVRSSAPAFAGLAAFMSARDLDLGRGVDAQRIRGRAVSQTFAPILGVRMAEGRWFLPQEDSTVGAHAVAVISHGFWERVFGGDPAVVGRTLLVNGQLLTVVGVTERGFSGIESDPVDMWVPFSMAPPLGLTSQDSRDWRDNPAMAMVYVVGRIAGGVPWDVAAQQATAAIRIAAEETPELDQTPELLLGRLVPAGQPQRTQGERLSLWLLAATGLVLLIACANVATLMFSRGLARQRETAVRSSLGAGRVRLFRQHMTESMIVALLGGLGGILLALWGARVAAHFSLPATAARLDGSVLLFALGLTLTTGVLFGGLPAWQAVRVDPADGLKQAPAGAPRGRRRLRSALVGLQVALTAALLVGAVLFLRSLREVYAVDPGIDTERILVVSSDLAKVGFELSEREAFYDQAGRRLAQMPAVEHVSTSQFGPFSANRYGAGFLVPGHGRLSVNGPYMDWVGGGYFETVGTAILQGRGITERDVPGSEPVAVVNESLAAALRPFGEVVGMCVAIGEQQRSGGCTRIVGIAENQRSDYLDSNVDPAVYLAHAQDPEVLPWAGTDLLVRTTGDPVAHAAEVRSALQRLRSDLPYVSVQPLEERIRSDLRPYRVGSTLFTLFAVTALLLAGVGLYGMLSYFIAERRRELGIRRSLGADRGTIMRFVLGKGMRPVAAGLLAGLSAAYVGVTMLQGMLFGVAGRDAATFAFVAAFLLVVALTACFLPASRAAKADPMVALRAE